MDCDQSNQTKTFHLPSEGGFACETDGINGKPSLVGGIKVGSKSWVQLGISALSLIMVDPLDSSVPSQEFVVHDYSPSCNGNGCLTNIVWDDPLICPDD